MSELETKLKEIEGRSTESRGATWCELCEEWVEKNMAVCRAGDKMPVTSGKIFIDPKPVKTLLAALRKAIHQRNRFTYGITSQDEMTSLDAALLAILNK